MALDYAYFAEFIGDKTNAEIADFMSHLHRRPVDIVRLTRWLERNGLLERDGFGWTGVLVDVEADANTPSFQKNRITKMFSARAEKDELALDNPRVSIWAQKLVDRLLSDGNITQECRDEFTALGGGLRFPDGVTEQEVADEITAQAARDAAQAAQEAKENKYQQAYTAHINTPLQSGTEAELVAGLRAAADAIEGA